MGTGDARELLAWFAANRRDLPWRGDFPRDPYRVLVSEVMLQQTQVDRVVDGFRRFVARFPTLETLAAASADDAVAAFAGMGYYGRARRLHNAAQAIVARGTWPRDEDSLRSLPGIGAYTAAAVAAFAFDGAEPPVDGNVRRVAARLLAAALPAGSVELTRRATSLARSLHAAAPGPELFEALMELGATVCTPLSPRCAACPLRDGCRGRGDPGVYPRPRPAAAPAGGGGVGVGGVRAARALLQRRVRGGWLVAGLWLPPFDAVVPDVDPYTAAVLLARPLGASGALEAMAPVRHAITRHRIDVHPFAGAVGPGVRDVGPDLTFRDPAAPGLPTSSLFEKLRTAASAPICRRLGELPGEPDTT